ncbi:integral membrane protein [Botryosphaeria dothidea]|uniref:Integral membrane protein n=1 Tax=Botryosphaeria dothidea TaxID=55169 RepID=A0A8H4N8S1_9PEZI|nr:integral membrane protein [Botryosphaeria dothidea]
MRVEIQGLRPLEDSDHEPGDRITAYLEADPETALQDVLSGFHDVHGWDGAVSWARYLTKLVNIQIVDSADFEASTHIVPPPTPVSAKDYADAGLPFYLTGESKQDRLNESKILNAIKSISGLDKKLGVGTSVDNDIDPAKPGKCCTCSTRLSDCVYDSAVQSQIL